MTLLKLGREFVKKGTKLRDEYAKLKRAHRLRTKLKEAKAGREQLKKSDEFKKTYINPASQELKEKMSQQSFPKSWRRAGKLASGGIASGMRRFNRGGKV